MAASHTAFAQIMNMNVWFSLVSVCATIESMCARQRRPKVMLEKWAYKEMLSLALIYNNKNRNNTWNITTFIQFLCGIAKGRLFFGLCSTCCCSEQIGWHLLLTRLLSPFLHFFCFYLDSGFGSGWDCSSWRFRTNCNKFHSFRHRCTSKDCCF